MSKFDLKSDLKQLFQFATAQTHFLFNGDFYNQIVGVAMSSPLAPILANVFMVSYEEKLLNEFEGKKPVFIDVMLMIYLLSSIRKLKFWFSLIISTANTTILNLRWRNK